MSVMIRKPGGAPGSSFGWGLSITRMADGRSMFVLTVGPQQAYHLVLSVSEAAAVVAALGGEHA